MAARAQLAAFVADVHPWEQRQRARFAAEAPTSFRVRRLLNKAVALPELATGALSDAVAGLGLNAGARRALAAPYIPTRMCAQLKKEERVYNALFSPSGRLLVSACQSEDIELHRVGHWSTPALRVRAQDVAWAVSSVDVSADDRHLVYSSMNSTLGLVDLDAVRAQNENSSGNGVEGGGAARRRAPPVGHVALDLTSGNEREMRWGRRGGFPVYQAKFSVGGTEVVAACGNNHIVTFDLERHRVVSSISAHSDDINSVCFVEPTFRSNLLATASDDGLLKIWDRREAPAGGSSSAPATAALTLCGHLAGLASVAPRGDGQYLITNGKDQCAKLWDLRLASSSSAPAAAAAAAASARTPPFLRFDYRWGQYPGVAAMPQVHPADGSVQTFRGHQVLLTLIRASFSPEETTGRRFIITGSACGNVFVYDIVSGEVVRSLSGHNGAVRDVAWHPTEPLIASASFDGSVGLFCYEGRAAAAMAERRVAERSSRAELIRAGRAERQCRLDDFEAELARRAAADAAVVWDSPDGTPPAPEPAAASQPTREPAQAHVTAPSDSTAAADSGTAANSPAVADALDRDERFFSRCDSSALARRVLLSGGRARMPVTRGAAMARERLIARILGASSGGGVGDDGDEVGEGHEAAGSDDDDDHGEDGMSEDEDGDGDGGAGAAGAGAGALGTVGGPFGQLLHLLSGVTTAAGTDGTTLLQALLTRGFVRNLERQPLGRDDSAVDEEEDENEDEGEGGGT